jgi:sugar phosphate isomerase/epimerase
MRTVLGFIGSNDLEGVREDCRFCAEHGFDGLEYNYWTDFRDLERDYFEAVHAIHRAHGIHCSMLGLWGWNHLSPIAAEREEAHRMLSRAIRFAQILEAEVLTTGGGVLGENAELEETVQMFAEVFPPFLEAMASGGMRPAFYAMHGNSFLDGIGAYERVWEAFPQVGIKFDPANWLHHGDDYLAVARGHGDRIAHLHIKEHVYADGALVSQPAAGMGDIEWGKLFAFLYERGYDGPLSVEPHGSVWGHGEMRRRMLLLTQRHIARFLV